MTNLSALAGGVMDMPVGRGPAPSLDYGADIGAALAHGRQVRGLSLDDIAAITRVRRSYLGALEEMRIDALPSRPFAIGYVRAYARALGLDGEAAVVRFRNDAPDPEEAVLRAPVGVEKKRDPRLAAVIAGGVVILAAIVGWNVVQRGFTHKETAAPAPAATEEVAPPAPAQTAPAPADGAVALGAPLPAPAEATTPAPYVTPGLAKATAAKAAEAGAVVDASAKAKAPEAAIQPDPEAQPGAPFAAKGEVYGAPADEASVVLQARKPTALMVRGEGGKVYFAKQLAAGESYRAPVIKGLTVEATDPASVGVYVGGALTGPLPAGETPVSKIAG